MKNTYLYWFLGIIGIVAVVWLFSLPGTGNTSASGAQSTSVGGGTLSAEEQLFDFGTISMTAGKVSHTFTIKNTSQVPVTITKMYTSCMCTVATLVTSSGREGPFGMPGMVGYEIPAIHGVIVPGEEASVEVVFDPAAHGPAGVGKLHRVIYLETGQGADNAFQLSFDATVTP